MKRFFRKYAVPVIAIVCVLALCGAWTGVRLSADAGTYRLDDIEGDRAYLDGIRIDMSLSDEVHTQHLTLKDGALSHSCSFTSPLKTYYPTSLDPSQMFVESPGADFQETTETTLQSSGSDYEFWLTRLTRKTDEARVAVQLVRHDVDSFGSRSSSQWAQVVTDITVRGEGYPFTFVLERDTTIHKNQYTSQGEPLPDSTSESPFSYAESDADPALKMGYGFWPLTTEAPDGTMYFTPSLMPYYGGTSAIYRVDEWGSWGIMEASDTVDGYPSFPDSNARELGRISKVAEFPAGGLRTVALDVVGDRLCLLLIADGMLTLCTYSLDGELEYELPLFAADPALETRSTLFTNQSGSDLMLCYYLQDPAYGSYEEAPPEAYAKLFCVRLGDTAQLMSVLAEGDSLKHAAFIGNHWVLADRVYKYDLLDSEHHYISVLDVSGRTLYRGEIITDEREDDIQNFSENGNDRSVSRGLTFDAITEE